jgi:hypothetical protein
VTDHSVARATAAAKPENKYWLDEESWTTLWSMSINDALINGAREELAQDHGAFKEWSDKEMPESEPLPLESGRKLSGLQELCLMRALRPGRCHTQRFGALFKPAWVTRLWMLCHQASPVYSTRARRIRQSCTYCPRELIHRLRLRKLIAGLAFRHMKSSKQYHLVKDKVREQ